jgi:phage/plasmid-like protein (TIGR03299 family)
MSNENELIDGRAVFLGRERAWWQLSDVNGFGRHFGATEIEYEAPEILMPVRKETPYVLGECGPGHNNGLIPLPKTCAVVRADGKIVGEGVGKDSYGLVQPRDLYDFGSELSQLNEWPLESAGTLREGTQFFFTFRTGGAGIEGFEVDTNLSVVSSHDGSLAAMALYSSTIVVCANTLAMALHGATDRIVFKHTTFVEDRMDAFLLARKGVEGHQQATRHVIARLGITDLRDFDLYLDGVLPRAEESAGKRAITAREVARDSVRELWNAPVVGDLKGTALGFVQAVNTFENWNAPVRGAKGQSKATVRAERQFDAMVKGQQPLTAKALALVTAA